MWQQIIAALRITIVFTVLTGLVYPGSSQVSLKPCFHARPAEALSRGMAALSALSCWVRAAGNIKGCNGPASRRFRHCLSQWARSAHQPGDCGAAGGACSERARHFLRRCSWSRPTVYGRP